MGREGEKGGCQEKREKKNGEKNRNIGLCKVNLKVMKKKTFLIWGKFNKKP